GARVGPAPASAYHRRGARSYSSPPGRRGGPTLKFLYQFSAGDSFVHRLDPRAKLVFLVCFLIATFLLPQPWVMPLVIIAIIWAFAGIGPLEYLPFLLFLLPLMLAISLVHVLSDGPPFFDLSLLGV